MTESNKKIIGWGIVICLILWGILMSPLRNNDEEPIETITPSVEEPTVEPVVEELVVEEENTEEEVVVIPPIEHGIVHFTDDGTLIAPYPDYYNFSDAFEFGRAMLGDSAEHGELRVFMWRGKKYTTETLKQSGEVKNTTVIDTLNN